MEIIFFDAFCKRMASLDNLIDVPEADQVLLNKLSIESLEQKVGSGNLSTTNNTLVGGLNEVHTALQSTQNTVNSNATKISGVETALGEQALSN